MQRKKNLVSVLSVVSFLFTVTVCYVLFGSEKAYCAENAYQHDNDLDSSLLEIVEQNNDTLQQKEANKTPKDKLLESVIRSKTQEAIQYRNYKAPEDPELKELKRSVNLENARVHGEEILAERKNGGLKKKQSQNLEQGLMSSFDKKKTDKKKYKVLDKKKEEGDSHLFKDQAGSVSNAFKKLK
ncbi:MAG: hypothetical protein IJ254_10145 [Succinivibrio sp.]|jgi:hypothetical protein|nr:hypothetical protein [Succinivibrio sp.]